MPSSPRTPVGRAGDWPALIVSGLVRAAASEPSLPDLLSAELTDQEVAAVDESSDDEWRVFFQTASARDAAGATLRARFPALAIQPADVKDEDWAARSQADLRAIQVGRIIVAPPWDVPTTIVIQPSTGFGTGHHATTRLCLAALQRIDLAGRRVLDVGTGSAVLAIAASLRGAGDVVGIDDDEEAIRAAWENLALNPGATVSLIVGDVRTLELSPADVILANLTGGLLTATADRLRRLTAARGTVILSGFMTHEEAAVAAAFAAFTVEHRTEEDGWACLTMTARP
jgi:ribosomal protein L11 methyltransferase